MGNPPYKSSIFPSSSRDFLTGARHAAPLAQLQRLLPPHSCGLGGTEAPGGAPGPINRSTDGTLTGQKLTEKKWKDDETGEFH